MERLLAYSAGERNTPATAELERHLAECTACREVVAGQQRVWTALEDWQLPPASSDFNRRLFARIEERVSWRDRLLQPFRPLWVRLTVPVAAAAGVAILAAVILDRPVTQPPQPRPASVEAAQPEQIEHALDDMQMLHDFNRAVRADAEL